MIAKLLGALRTGTGNKVLRTVHNPWYLWLWIIGRMPAKHFKFNWNAAVWAKIKWADQPHCQTMGSTTGLGCVCVCVCVCVFGIVSDGFRCSVWLLSDCQASMCLGRVSRLSSAHFAISCMQISFWTCCNLLVPLLLPVLTAPPQWAGLIQ